MSTKRVPSGWVSVPLEQVAEVHDNLREPVNAEARSKRVGPYPYYGATGQVGWIDNFRQDGEFVLLGEDGAPFLEPTKSKAYLVSGRCWVNNHAHVLRGIAGLCANKYLLYALNTFDYYGFVSGTTRLKLTQAAMRRIPVRLAPSAEQDRIVGKLDELFSDLEAGVAALQRVAANLKRYRASVLKAAVDGSLTAEWRKTHPTTEPASALLQRILDERRATWEREQQTKATASGRALPANWKTKYKEPVPPDTTDLPALPAEWCWVTMDHFLAGFDAGKNFRCLEREPLVHEVGVVKVSSVSWGRFDETESKTCTRAELVNEGHMIRRGDFLFSRANTIELVGACVIVQDIDKRLMLSDKVLRFRTVGNLDDWLLWVLRSRHGRREIETLATGNQESMRNIGQDRIKRIRIPLAPMAELSEIMTQVRQHLSVIDHEERAMKKVGAAAARLKSAILRTAFEGKLVPQQESDEPASTLLERIRTDRAGSSTTRTRPPRSSRAAQVTLAEAAE